MKAYSEMKNKSRSIKWKKQKDEMKKGKTLNEFKTKTINWQIVFFIILLRLLNIF